MGNPKMKSTSLLIATAIMLFAQSVTASDEHAGDSRQLVEFPPQMRQHMLGNMRNHLMAISEIQQALSEGNFDKAADTAETRLGMSSLAAHGAEHMAAFMPEKMQTIGSEMHRSASRFAVIAQESAVEGNFKNALAGLAKITQNCVACHAAFRVH
jgi:DNA-binding transcriptional MerR regulator